MTDNLKRGPLISAGILMGAGLGGFVDGIVFHQILQVHNMLSNRIPPNDLVSAKINMTWDGYFHAAVWVMTAVGLYLLFRAGQRRDVPWSGKILLGSLIAGFGLFNWSKALSTIKFSAFTTSWSTPITSYPTIWRFWRPALLCCSSVGR
jgi:uncharacterized membrane protein